MSIWRELAVRLLRKAFRKNQIEHIHENMKTYGNVNNNFHQNVNESNRKLQDVNGPFAARSLCSPRSHRLGASLGAAAPLPTPRRLLCLGFVTESAA